MDTNNNFADPEVTITQELIELEPEVVALNRVALVPIGQMQVVPQGNEDNQNLIFIDPPESPPGSDQDDGLSEVDIEDIDDTR